MKHLLFHEEARNKILAGATAMADAVRITLGPKARCVLIGKPWGTPLVCDDGVTIARELTLEDPEQDLGAKMLRQVAERTGEAVGDGTTTATLVAHAILAEGVRNIVAGASAIDLKKGLDRGLELAVESVRSQSKPVTGRLETLQVATISAHNDPAVGEVVADAVEQVGRDGVITVEEAKGTTTELEVVEGMRFDRGYLSPYFVTDPEKMECVFERPLLLLTDRKLMSAPDVVPLLEQVAQSGRPLLIVAESVEAEALALLVVNRLRGTLLAAAVKAPGFGDRRKEMLEDLAVLTGGQVAAEELGIKLDQVELADLGGAERVIIGRDHTTVVGGHGDKPAIEARVHQLREQARNSSSDYDREKLEERIARLAGGVAVVRVGAPTEAGLKRLREAFDDSINATRAALAEGIVPGAGLPLLRAARAIDAAAEQEDGDLKTGLRILSTALEVPTRQIAINSGLDAGVVIQNMLAAENGVGLDATTGEYLDLLEAGIVDATKVVRVGLENAVSLAGILLLAEATLTDVPDNGTAEHPVMH